MRNHDRWSSAGWVVGLGLAAGLVGLSVTVGASRSGLPEGVSLSQAKTIESGGAGSFVNWETPHVHPLDMTSDGQTLLAVNTAAGRLEVFDLASGAPVHAASVPVGVEPVTVRARNDGEAWVVNHLSDSVSVVDLAALNVVRTIDTNDEPCDVVFAGSPRRAYVSCSQANQVQVFDPAAPDGPLNTIGIEAEDPRALAVSPDGLTVYAAVYESGNDTTILGGGSAMGGGFPPNVVNDPSGPWGGVNPPPNDGMSFKPAQKAGNPDPPAVGLIVRKDDQGRWMDDNGGDWTELVSGADAALSGRPVGWDLLDHDVAMIDTATDSVSYQTGLMNICMALAVKPVSGDVTVVGTDAINHIRYEPILNGRFLRVNLAAFAPASAGAAAISDLNPHLVPHYTEDVPFSPVAQSERDRSIGDPRAIVWNSAETLGYVAGMGSNNVIVIDGAGARAGLSDTIEVGAGPTGLALDEARDALYVLNRFDAAVSVVDTLTETETQQVAFFDPTPASVDIGRRLLYGTHETSGLGHISCASCHVDARMDRLAWDLGDPSGDVKPFDQNCISGGCEDWHPMKGPMTTQTMQDIIKKEPHHWRADRFGIEEFNGAFMSLLGDDEPLSAGEMQAFEDFLASIHFPPNPFRNFDNSLPSDLPLPGHFTTGRFGPPGQPLPNGDALAGLDNYRLGGLDGVQCVTCHTLPTGIGPNGQPSPGGFQEIPPGPNGELHHGVVSVDGSTNVSIKVPHLRNMHEKSGFNITRQTNTAGFGYLHDGSVSSIERFIAEPVFSIANTQEVADMVAFMLAFAGSDLPEGSSTSLLEPPGPPSLDTHAAVGAQITLDGQEADSAAEIARTDEMIALAEAGEVGLIVKGVVGGERRGFFYAGSDLFQSDRAAETLTTMDLRSGAATGGEVTFTVVPVGTETRLGVDGDEDGAFDQDEEDAGSDPNDPDSLPGDTPPCPADLSGDGAVDGADLGQLLQAWGPAGGDTAADLNGDGAVDGADLGLLLQAWGGCAA